MGSLSSLWSLHLGDNCFSRIIPLSYRHLTRITTLDLSENNIIGKVPTWIGERFSILVILNLHSNKFHDSLPITLCCLSSLHIMDLVDNNLHRSIPKCINNFSVMVTIYPVPSNIGYFAMYCNDNLLGGLFEDAIVAMKGKVMK